MPEKKLCRTDPRQIGIEAAPDGLILTRQGHEIGRIIWNDVQSVVAYKRDFITYDTVCLSIEIGHAGKAWHLCDESVGFWDAAASMKRALPGCDQHWEESVIKPAFAGSEKLIFSR